MSAPVGRSLGRYRLEALLGQGGMAEVYRATDTKLARTVAVKVILAAHAVKGDFLERFLREARMVASLEHPNILPVYDFGEDDGVPFLVMPYLSGGSLRERLKAGAAPLALASSWIAELADALDAAHAAGVLHRDVKPANVLLGRNDRLFLADFGIAKMLESQSGLTATGVVVGTPVYMAPEQAQGRPATPATDRYALAVVAYEILSGRPPFEGENPLSLMHQHVSSPPPPLSTRVGGLPAGLDAVLSQALAKDPAARPSTCRALAEMVAAFAPAGITPPPSLARPPRGAATSPTILGAPEMRPVTVARGTTPWSPPSTPPPVRLSGAPPSLTSEATVLMGSRRTARRAMMVAAAALAALAGAWWIVARRPAPESAPRAAPPAAAPVPAAVPPVPTAPAAAASEPAPAAVVEKAEKVPPVTKLPPPPSAEADAGVPSAGGPGDQAHPLRAARERLEPAKKVTHRLAKEDFQFALDEAQRVLKLRPLNPEAKHLETYARGGLAYVAGNDSLAGAALVETFTEVQRRKTFGSRPAGSFLLKPDGSVRQPTALDLALGYGDARGEAKYLIEKELAANPRSVRALKARAQLRRMQGLDEPRPNRPDY